MIADSLRASPLELLSLGGEVEATEVLADPLATSPSPPPPSTPVVLARRGSRAVMAEARGAAEAAEQGVGITNQLGSRTAARLVEVLRRDTPLQCLRLSGNGSIGAAACLELLSSLQTCATLHQLHA